MRLEKVRQCLDSKFMKYHYTEEDGCGSLEFEYRGVFYHVWEFPEGERGAESNVRNAGRNEEFYGDYEAAIVALLEKWN